MKAPAKVVMKRVGRRMSRAKPTQTTVKMRAPRTPITRAATSAKTSTPMVRTTKRPRGIPVRAIWERRNDCIWAVSATFEIFLIGRAYRKHRLLCSEFGDLGIEILSLFWWKEAVEVVLTLA